MITMGPVGSLLADNDDSSDTDLQNEACDGMHPISLCFSTFNEC